MILITGASSGIGEACAWTLAGLGHKLILVARRKERLMELSTEIEKKHKNRPICFQMDIRDSSSINRTIQDHQDLFAEVNVLVNNAGLAKGFGPFQDGKIEDWNEMIDTNIKGLLYVTRGVIPFMIRKSDGHIVNIGSVAGYWTYPNGNVYSSSKFAVRGITESLRLDLLGTGIRVTEIAPGMVNTEFSGVRFGDKEKADAVYQGMNPLKAEDIAEAVAWSINRPKRVNIQEIVIYPTDQASPTTIHRKIE